MAGSTPILIESDGTNHGVPDFHQTISFQLSEPNLAAADNSVIFYAERDTVVESVVFTSASTDANITIDLKSCPSGTGPAAGGTEVITQVVGVTAWTPVAATIDTTENIVPAGSFLALAIVDGSANADYLHVQMRIRTRIV